ncbi:ShlB/FhaC/HecB family hemolysin secretion/activation protein [uncultured Megasphaera sp.]|jgi:hemolysin activation/secretion protein|uniref:ShlB/FhaC/HecB family hemolysin secretion/activation protein n=1 Tax=uncultured Megasphaera sp. TaxID=165188 RepID=UPI0025D639A4|nr:ShlB/FhaC/HecB family hemolysin secretion/activation protein [uncultured Megasphaera sp.]
MDNKEKWKFSLATALTFFILSSAAYAAEPQQRPQPGSDSGVQLSRTRQYLEYQRMQQRLTEGPGIGIESNKGAKEEAKSNVSFTLKAVETSPSQVFQKEDIQKLAAPYLQKNVSLDDLYALVNKINEQYREKGLITCRAFLAPQTIHDGIVRIELVEGKTGQVSVAGNPSTRSDYITSRVHLPQGSLANVKELDKELLRFNATNDAQLHLSLKAGAAPGTTDYFLSLAEPQKEVFGLFADNAGYKTSGLYRGGMYWQDRSLLGNRDSLFMSMVFSKGTKAFASSYTAPVNHHGAKAGVSYSTNSVHIIDGPLEPLNVRGHSYAYNFFVTRPVRTTETLRSEVGFEYNYQHSQTSFFGMPWVNDRLSTFHVYYDQIDYGKTTIFYQKHGYRFGRYTNISDVSRNYGKYELNTLFQKVFPHGQGWTLRLDGQLSSTQYLPSAEMFYLGGLYSVRGYKESLIGGDGGFMASAEYAVPVSKNKKTSAYVFLDGGRVWGSSAFGDRSLVGTGLGIKSDVGSHTTINIALAFPLIRTINDEEQSRTRIHFSFNSSF